MTATRTAAPAERMDRGHAGRSARRHRRPVAGRSYHIVDLENLCGAGLPAAPAAPAATAALERYVAAGMGACDFGVVAVNRSTLRRLAFVLPRALRWVAAGTGPDAADTALLGAVDARLLARRFERVVIGSGDGAFADLAATLKAAGVDVVVVTWPGQLSAKLATAASRVVELGPLDAATCGRAEAV